MRLKDALGLESLRGARVVAAARELERDVRWADVVDVPAPAAWVMRDHLLLTTGYAWPQGAAAVALIDELWNCGIAAIGLAVPGYLDRFDDAVRERAGSLGLPLVEIPWEVPFARITEELHRAILAERESAIARSEAIHRELTRGASTTGSLSDLAERLGRLLDRAVTIEDEGGSLLAAHGDGAQIDAARRETLAARASPERLLEALARLGYADALRGANAPLRIPALPELELAARVVCPIRIGGDLAGFVWIIEGASPLTDLDHRAAEHAALVAALHIAHQRELATLEARLGYASFVSFLETRDSVDARTIERIRLVGFDPEAAYRVGIAALDEPLPLGRDGVLRRDQLAERVRRQLLALGVARPVLGASLDRIPFLLPHGVPAAAILPALAGEAARVVVGRANRGPEGVRESYREARGMLAHDGPRPLATFEDVLLPRVLDGDREARAAFVQRHFGALAARKGGATLREALATYAEHGFHFRRTATALGIHPNTLRYRLDLARQATGMDIDDPSIRFELGLAARLLRLAEGPDSAEPDKKTP